MSYPSRRRKVVSGLGTAAFYDVALDSNDSTGVLLAGDSRAGKQDAPEVSFSPPTTGIVELNNKTNVADALTALYQVVGGDSALTTVVTSRTATITANRGFGKSYRVYHDSSSVDLYLEDKVYPEFSNFTIYSSAGPNKTGGARPSRAITVHFGNETYEHDIKTYEITDVGSGVRFEKVGGTFAIGPMRSNVFGDEIEPGSTNLAATLNFTPAATGVDVSFSTVGGAAISSIKVEVFEYPSTSPTASGGPSETLTVTVPIVPPSRTITLEGVDQSIAPVTVTDTAGAAPAVTGSLNNFQIPSISLGDHNVRLTIVHAGGTIEQWSN